MNDKLRERLNRIESVITSRRFLNSKGLGNEIAFYIFDYPPEEELEIRDFVDNLVANLKKRQTSLRIAYHNLFKLLVNYLKQRRLLEPALKMQKENGNTAILKALKGPLHESKIASEFVGAIKPEGHDLVILTGIGSAWPLIRTHTLLNALQPMMKNKPLVVFYPGKFDGQSFRLFDKVGSGSYYRAFQLVT